MALSPTEIANQALGRVGATRIADLTDDTQKNARVVNNVFWQTVREVGAAGEWNCLKDRATLAQLATAPAFEWAYQYQLPPSYLRMVNLNVDRDGEGGDDFEIEQGKLLTDAEEARIQYIAYVEDTNLFDPLFTNAVVVLLAAKIAVPLRQEGGAQLASNFLEEYITQALPKARMKDGGERKAKRFDPTAESNWVNARRYSTNG